ncbi:MAG: ABC transporter ATP-binding protein/permease, partial [Oscillospiraceae bacterium]|nr:ABC transporter ATP-binding protein/permease [Oscillospiraceae bacterium]
YALFAGLFSLLAQVLLAKPLARIAARKLDKIAGAAKTLGDIFAGGVIARVFDLRGRLMEIFGRDNDEIRRLIRREARINGAQELLGGSARLLTTGGVFAAGSLLIARGDMTLPALMALVPLCSSVAWSISGIGYAWAGLQAPLEAGRRVYETLGGDNRLDPLPETKQPPAAEGCRVEVKNLSFAFEGAETPLFEDVSLTVEENRFAAFVGESGGGKSTLLKVIAGLYEREGLDITVGGKRFSEVSLEEWRGYFAYVDQSCTLFNLTIAENIALGKEGASMDEVRAAAALADADAFISALPRGYDTPAGEVGGTLSGGQRQRIAIARALIRRAPVLVFDEATSALDPESEREVSETIGHLRGRHTILMVTHNLPSVQPDTVFTVRDRKVLREG